MTKPELSIIIIEYNSWELTLKQQKVFSRFPEITSGTWELIIVDQNLQNSGYYGGICKGRERTRANYMLFLNPDVTISNDAIKKLLKTMKSSSSVGVVGPAFVSENNETQLTSETELTLIERVVEQTWLAKLFPAVMRKKFSNSKLGTQPTPRELLNGACFLVSKTVAESLPDLGSFHHYWEEHLISHIAKKLKLQLLYVPTATATHSIGYSLKKSSTTISSALFQESRARYLRYLYGFVQGSLAEIFIRTIGDWRVVLLFTFSVAIRTMNIDGAHVFPDMGSDGLKAVEMISHHSFHWMGIPSSIPRFLQGPAQSWFMASALLLFGMNYLSIVISSILLTSIGLIVFYLAISSFSKRSTAFLVSIVFITTPGLYLQSRSPFYLQFVQVSVPFALLLLSQRKVSWTAFGVSLGLIYQSVLSTIPIVASGVLLSMVWTRFQLKKFLNLVYGVGAVMTPQLIYDMFTHCSQLCVIPLWIGYKVASPFVQATISTEQTSISFFTTVTQIWAQLVFALGSNTSAVLVCSVAVLGVFISRGHRNKLLMFSAVGLVMQVGAVFVHGYPSEAYFPGVIVLLLVFLAVSIERYSALKYVVVGLVAMNMLALPKYNFTSYSEYSRAVEYILSLPDVQKTGVALRTNDPEAIHPSYLQFLEFLLVLDHVSVFETGTPVQVSLHSHLENTKLDFQSGSIQIQLTQ